jgi:hypothetical protein
VPAPSFGEPARIHGGYAAAGKRRRPDAAANTGAATTAPIHDNWYDHEVVVRFSAKDDLSGVDLPTVSPDVTLGEGASQVAAGSAQDLAGNSGSGTLTDINVDLSPPTPEISSPPAAATYPNTAEFPLVWSPNAGISGVEKETGTVNGASFANGERVSLVLFPPGSHVAFVEVVDQAMHVADDTVTFEVTVNLPGLLAALRGACANDWVNKFGICMSLEAKVLAGLDSAARADLTATAGQLGAFLNELEAQWDKAINAQGYLLLRADAEYVLAHLG